MHLFQQPCHIVGQGAHGLHALVVKRSLSFLASIDDVPVLRSHHGHVHHLEGHVQCLERCGGSTPSAYAYRCGRLVLHLGASRVEQPLHQRQHRAVGLSVIDRRADNERVGVVKHLTDAVADVVVEDAAAMPLRLALVTGDAAPDGLHANLHNLSLNALFLQCAGHLAQCHKGVALSTGAAVD